MPGHKDVPGYYTETRQLEPLEVLPPEGVTYIDAKMLINGSPRYLPPGASIDGRSGSFRFMPGPGFNSTYTFILTGTRKDGETVLDRITIKVKPKH